MSSLFVVAAVFDCLKIVGACEDVFELKGSFSVSACTFFAIFRLVFLEPRLVTGPLCFRELRDWPTRSLTSFCKRVVIEPRETALCIYIYIDIYTAEAVLSNIRFEVVGFVTFRIEQRVFETVYYNKKPRPLLRLRPPAAVDMYTISEWPYRPRG